MSALACKRCASELGPVMTACPSCGWLVYEDQLAALADAARQSTDAGDLTSALAHWREAYPLLPDGSRQHQIIRDKINQLSQSVSSGTATTAGTAPHNGSKAAAGLGAIGLMAWKLKALLLGLTKSSTLFSMLASLGVYWSLWGWKFALGLVLSIYIHEMGHVLALRRYGFKASAPMFIPGLGAVIRLQQQVANPLEDAEIGLAGPVYGCGAAIVTLGIWYVTRQPIFAAIAGIGAWINLFNLMPLGMLDGGRAFHALSRLQKFLCVVAAGAAYAVTEDGMILLIGLVGVGRLISDTPKGVSSWKSTITYVGLFAVLTAISMARLWARRDFAR